MLNGGPSLRGIYRPNIQTMRKKTAFFSLPPTFDTVFTHQQTLSSFLALASAAHARTMRLLSTPFQKTKGTTACLSLKLSEVFQSSLPVSSSAARLFPSLQQPPLDRAEPSAAQLRRQALLKYYRRLCWLQRSRNESAQRKSHLYAKQMTCHSRIIYKQTRAALSTFVLRASQCQCPSMASVPLKSKDSFLSSPPTRKAAAQ